MRKLIKFLLFFIIFLFAAALLIIAVTPDNKVHNGGPTIETNPAINWNGTWTQTDESDTATMVATINDGVIEININAPDSSALYWKGTWPAMPTGDTQTITSVADREALDASMLGSQSDTKTFSYKDDKLSFEFQALGVKRTLHLKHDA